MNSFLPYLLQAATYQSIWWLGYHFLLRKSTAHSANRGYLLFGLISSLLLPFLDFSFTHVTSKPTAMTTFIATKIQTQTQQLKQITSDSFINAHWIELIFSLISVVFALRFLCSITKTIFHSYQQKTNNQQNNLKVFRTHQGQPFSFFNWIFLPDHLSKEQEKMILAHETQHAILRHSYDRVLVEIMLILFWFNPFIHLLKQSLIQIHEYEVDARVCRQFSQINYQQCLLSMQQSRFSGLGNYFSFPSIKKRIIMMNHNNHKSHFYMGKIASIAAFVAIIVALSSFDINIKKHIENNNSKLELGVAQPIKTKAEIPSIFPIDHKNTVDFKVSSTFGMRKHPITNEQKHHNGIDIAAPTGTPVIATASGKITFAAASGAYGNLVTIQHEDGYSSRYAQLDSFSVKEGDLVVAGQKIGEVGSSGNSTGPHLHYEVMKDNHWVDPVDFIKDYTFSQSK